jgi:hypothetical protein
MGITRGEKMEFILIFIFLSIIGLTIFLVSPFITNKVSGKLWIFLSVCHLGLAIASLGNTDISWSLYSLLGVFLMFCTGIFLIKTKLPVAYISWIFVILWNSIPLISGDLGFIMLIIGSLWAIIWRKRFFGIK